MPMMKYARASIIRPKVTGRGWAKVRKAAKVVSKVNENLVARAGEILGKSFDPKDHLLTHATIVASVDTEEPSGVKTGSLLVGGFRVNRKYTNYRVKLGGDKYINHNLDFWDRDVLLKSYRTFIGGHNFCFAAGTQVLLEDGTYRPIEEIQLGDRVVTHTGAIQAVTHKFIRDYEGPIQAVNFDRFKNPIMVTGNHPFRAISTQADPIKPRKGSKSANTVRYWRDQVVSALRGETTSLKGFRAKKDWTRADELAPGSYVLGAERVQGSRSNEDLAELLVSEGSDFAWWGGCRVHRVASNTTIPFKGKVYNLEVEGDQSYVVDYGIAVHNCEHVQVEDLSKGRIIDAVVRDIGDSLYVDILIATDRKHTDLVAAILSGKMSTLSMGCTIEGSSCTKCGHWAADETEQCPCMKYEKGNTFFDEQGRQHRVAEQCGNKDIEPTGGVQFVEASWVGTPAFTGAVLRNIIDVTPALAEKAAAILAQPPAEWSQTTQRKAASRAPDVFMAGWEDEDADEDADEDEGEGGDKPDGGPFDEVEQELTDHMRDRVKKKLKKDMDEKDIDDTLNSEHSLSTNDNLVKQGGRVAMDDLVPDVGDKLAYGGKMAIICRAASCNADLFNKVALLNTEYGVNIPMPLYRTALQLGSVDDYSSLNQFVRACKAALGRKPTTVEAGVLLRLGRLIPLRGQARLGSTIPGSRPSEGDQR